MRKLTKPIEKSAEEVFTTCISEIESADLKRRLTACTTLVGAAASEFDTKMPLTQLYTIVQESLINGNVTAAEMIKVYTNWMLGKDSSGRKIYEKLKAAPKHSICPLCSHRKVETLDHHLSKSKYPRLSVTPFNLIPACSDCNKSKRSDSPTKPEEETLHPYYDDIEDVQWLDARIIQNPAPSVQFFVNPPSLWSALLTARVQRHFDCFSINDLYCAQAGAELAELKHHFSKLHNDTGADGIRKFLAEGEEGRQLINQNSWRVVMYRTLKNSTWFCESGWSLIAT